MGIKNKQHGFTIVEIAIVVVVIAILVTITTVAITGNLNRARETARASDVSTIMNALEKYYETHGDYPYGAAMNPTSSPSQFDYGPVKALMPSLTDSDLTGENGFYFWAHPGSGFASTITHHNQMPKQYMYLGISDGVAEIQYYFPYSAGRPYYPGCTITVNNSYTGGYALAWRNESTGIWTFKKGNRGSITISNNGSTQAPGQTCTFS